MRNIRVYEDHLKPGESRPANLGPWCYVVSENGHVIASGSGYHSKDEAREEAETV